MQSSPRKPQLSHAESEAHAGPQGCRVVCRPQSARALSQKNMKEERAPRPQHSRRHAQPGGGSIPKEWGQRRLFSKCLPSSAGTRKAGPTGGGVSAQLCRPPVSRCHPPDSGTGLGHSAVRGCPVKSRLDHTTERGCRMKTPVGCMPLPARCHTLCVSDGITNKVHLFSEICLII